MELLKFFLDNVGEDNNYLKFKQKNESGFTGVSGSKYSHPPLHIENFKEAIDKFKKLSHPSKEKSTTTNKVNFILLCFYLYKNSYYITEFPEFLSNPSNLEYFSNNIIRDYLIKNEKDDNGTVRWSTRRTFVNELTFESSSPYYITKQLEALFQKVSTRNAEFQQMSKSEKLKEIANALEHKLKIDDKFISINSEDYLDFITDEKIKEFRKNTMLSSR